MGKERHTEAAGAYEMALMTLAPTAPSSTTHTERTGTTIGNWVRRNWPEEVAQVESVARMPPSPAAGEGWSPPRPTTARTPR